MMVDWFSAWIVTTNWVLSPVGAYLWYLDDLIVLNMGLGFHRYLVYFRMESYLEMKLYDDFIT